MDNNRTLGIRNAVQSMLYYYITTLLEDGVTDPKQVIATDIGKMIELSEEQVAYVRMHLSDDIRFKEELEMSQELLKGMKANKKLDEESIDIILGILNTAIKQIDDAINNYVVTFITDEEQ